MTAELRALLQVQHAEHIAPWLFFRMVAQGRSRELKPRPIASITRAWRVACRAAGCPGRIPQNPGGRTAVRSLVRAGIPERVAMQMTGHKTRSVFERYNNVSTSDFTEAAKKLTKPHRCASVGASSPSKPASTTPSAFAAVEPS